MAESVALTKRASGGFKLAVTDFGGRDYTKETPAADYVTNSTGVKLIARAKNDVLMYKHYEPELWTVGVTTGFTTIEEVCNAIDALALS